MVFLSLIRSLIAVAGMPEAGIPLKNLRNRLRKKCLTQRITILTYRSDRILTESHITADLERLSKTINILLP